MGKKTIKVMTSEFAKNLSKDFSVERIILFGSRARGDFNSNSDIDLIIVSKDFENMKPFERSSLMYMYWKQLFPVDFICYTPKEFKYLKKRISLVSEALKEGFVVV